jgi:hypothetical protein
MEYCEGEGVSYPVIYLKGCRLLALTKAGVDFSASPRAVIQVLSSVELYEKIRLTQEYFRYCTTL